MLVWTIDRKGARSAQPIIRAVKKAVPASHHVVRLLLSDGRTLDASPGHPLTSGQQMGTLTAGQQVDGAAIVSAKRVPYKGGFTYDILPAGETGFYWANGILIGSTITGK